tara:strand:+ start:318 stop:869 length:552 start_codon:yes stop_codon:yes gene_type:complete
MNFGMPHIHKASIQTKDTLSDKAVIRIVKPYLKRAKFVIDPFSRNCTLAKPYTNDIDPNTNANHHMDVIDFLKKAHSLWKSIFELAIYDPPFSNRQNKEIYGDTNLYTIPKKVRDLELLLGGLIIPKGHIIKFGYNSNFTHQGFELVDVHLIQYGGSINDMIVSIHQRTHLDIKELENYGKDE